MSQKKIKIGSRWLGSDRDVFIVIGLVEQDGHLWVHYRNDRTAQEYSCWADSFTQRFTEYSNYKYPQ